MFEGNAEEAMNLYTSVFEDSAIINIQRYEDTGKVMFATFSLQGQIFRCIDSTVKHAFTFTPSVSVYVEFEKAEDLDHVFSELSIDGGVLMPLDAYPFSKRFAWISDRYGVSWQLTLAAE
jgi:predicted 3-demethylubiquinone-9 3-methyltransferase (glyoxalase superfamily)